MAQPAPSSLSPLQRKLAATRRWWRTIRVASGFGWTLCLLLVLALVCYHTDRLWPLSAGARESWRLGIGLAALLALGVALLRPLLKRLPDNAVAADVERRFPILRERLLTTLDLAPALATASAAYPTPFSPALTAALATETEQATTGMNFRRAVNLRPLGVSSLAVVFSVGLFVLEALLAPQAFAVWLRRMANPSADIAPYAKTRVQIMPAHTLLPRGADGDLIVKTWGDKAEKASLRVHQAGDAPSVWNTLELAHPTPPTKALADEPDARWFRYRLPHLTQSVTLVASANDGRSNERVIRVEDRPALLNLRYTLHFPGYMKREPQTLADSASGLVAPVGTEVEVQATANKPLHTARWQWEKQTAQAWRVAGKTVTGHFPVAKNGAFQFGLTDNNGFANEESPRYTVSATPDDTPTVQITRPASDMDLVPGGSVPLVAHASDDHGVNALRLLFATEHADTSGGGKPHAGAKGSLPLPGANGQPNANAQVRWNIGLTGPKPGDILRYEVDAWDNDTLNGPHVGRSSAYRVHVVSLSEMQRRLKDQLDEEARTLASLRQRQTQAQQQTQQARQKPNATNLNQAQQAERSLAQEAKALAQRMDSLTQSLENNNLATKSEQQRRDQAQQAVQNASQQKMTPAADALQKAQALKSGERASQTAQASKAESAAQQELAKAQQLLARADDPKKLAEEAARLAQEQQRLADSARSLAEDIASQKKQNPNAALSPEQREGLEAERRQQAQANRDTQKLEQQLKQAAQSAQERGEKAQADALQKAADALKQGQATQNQSQAQASLNRNSPQSAAPSQDKAAAALQKAAQAAQQAARQNESPSPQTAAEQLEQAAKQLRELAQKQQQLANQAAQKPDASQTAQMAQQQRDLQQQAQQAQQNLSGSKSAQSAMQQAQQNMSQSSQQLAQNHSQSAQKPAQDAAKQLQQAAQNAERAAQQLRQQQMAQEMQEKVERMAQIERALQSATKRLEASQKATGGLNAGQRREQQQIASRQQRNEQQAQELAGKFPSPAFQQALQTAGQQMHPATENLNKGEPDIGPETQNAQNRAAQTLETISQALKAQAQSNQQQQQQQGEQQQQGGQSAQQQQQAEALGELMLARGLQQQVRRGTGDLNQARRNQQLTPAQQREANQLREGQQAAQKISERARQSLQDLPDAQQQLTQAEQQMSQSGQKLGQQQTGQPTQTNQDQAMQHLDVATKQVQQAMQQQQQQQQQQASQQGQGQGMPKPNGQGNRPQKAITRLEGVKRGAAFAPENRSGRGFAGLPPRQQRVMREGQQERAPAEYQDVVNRYYKSLAEKKR